MRFLWVVIFVLVCVAADPNVARMRCPVCDMDVQPGIRAPIHGHQHVWACEMAGHLEQLTKAPQGHLGQPMPMDAASDRAYQNATEMQCPVCGMSFTHLQFAVAWGPVGNQKIWACSQAHAQMLLDHPLDYIGKDETRGVFCNMGAGASAAGSIMFNGFQLAMGKDRTCATLLFPTWVLSSGVKYALGIVGVLLLGMSMEGFGRLRAHAEEVLGRHFGDADNIAEGTVAEALSLVGSGYEKLTENATTVSHHHRIPFWGKIALAALYALNLAVAYLLMLVAMMYETFFFLAVVVGLALGFFVFNEMSTQSRQIDPCCTK